MLRRLFKKKKEVEFGVILSKKLGWNEDVQINFGLNSEMSLKDMAAKVNKAFALFAERVEYNNKEQEAQMKKAEELKKALAAENVVSIKGKK